jgi:hypothetical protein
MEGEKDIADFIALVDTNSGGLLDPAEREKAVDCVQQDLQQRGIGKDGGAGVVSDGAQLGWEARRLSRKPTRFGPHGDNEVRAAFGLEAFVESLLLLGCMHMHADGKSLKVLAPGGLKGLWLVAFLQHRFDLLSTEPTPPSTARLSSSRLGSKSSLALGGRALPDASNQSIAGSDVQRRHSADGPVRPPVTDAKQPTPAGQAKQPNLKLKQAVRKMSKLLKEEAADQLPVPPTPPPCTAAYATSLQCLLNEHRNLFAELDGRNDEQSCADKGAGPSGKLCEVCQHVRDERGFGNIFCHACSGVDDLPLKESQLYPVFLRRRLTHDIKELCPMEQRHCDTETSPRSDSNSKPPNPADAATSTAVEILTPHIGLAHGRDPDSPHRLSRLGRPSLRKPMQQKNKTTGF